MGREARRVPKDWVHPSENGRLVPLSVGYSGAVKHWNDMVRDEGLQAAIEYCGSAPDARLYMPEWPDSERTHWMMYETCSEGTPISPAFETPEELARWLADNGASAFGSMTATYEQWLATIRRGGTSCSMVVVNGPNGATIQSGVAAMEGGAK